MIVFCNGVFLPDDEAKISVLDRGFLYGDGLFETLRICQGNPFRWAAHLCRLKSGAQALGIRIPLSDERLRSAAAELVQRNACLEGLLRITLSRGVGQRGYSTAGAEQPTVVMTLDPSPRPDVDNPADWSLVSSSLRLASGDPLVLLKTCNKLLQVLARTEAERRGGNEALLLNENGEATEGSSSNLFWIEHGVVWTPPLSSPALPGITRSVIFELCQELELAVREARSTPEKLCASDGIFLTMSSLGVVEAVSLDGAILKRSAITPKLHRAYQQRVTAETLSSAVMARPRPARSE